MKHTGLFLMAGALLGVSAIRVSAGDVPAGGRVLTRHASVPAIATGKLPASDPSAIARRWGVEIASLRLASGGYMLEFRYRILDATKAQPLFDPKIRPMLKDEASGFESVVPNPPTTGSLRSTYDAKAGRTYFMFFANPSQFVTAGKTVSVTIGDFIITGIPVTDDSKPLAIAQAPTGHEGHIAQMATEPKDSPGRLMDPQPDIPDVTLVDQSGQATTLLEAIGTDKPVLVNFIFTTCTTICPVMTAGMSQFLANLGDKRHEVRVISISIDPEVDRVETLRAYAARHHASPSWRFMTGSPAAIEAAQRAFGAYRGGKNNHAPGTYVRSTKDGPWVALDGFSSAEMLMQALLGHLVPSQS